MYDPKIHHRRSIRLKNYDYAAKGLYFITLCSAQRKNLFGRIIHGGLFLNSLGKIAKEEWAKTPEIRDNTSPGEFIIMPNHMHGIISIDFQSPKPKKVDIGKFHSPSHTIGAIIRGYKGATTRRIHQLLRKIKEGSPPGEWQFAPTIKIPKQQNYYNPEPAYLLFLWIKRAEIKISDTWNLPKAYRPFRKRWSTSPAE